MSGRSEVVVPNELPPDEDWQFLFDLCGYIVVRGVLTRRQLDAANRAVDSHSDELWQAGPRVTEHATEELQGPARRDLRNMLGWEPQYRRPFVDMLAHPRLVPYLNVICGKGFRMDHAPTLITQEKGAPRGNLHGSSGPGFDPNQYYIWKNNRMHNGLVVVAWQLVDVNDGDGGLAVVRGT